MSSLLIADKYGNVQSSYSGASYQHGDTANWWALNQSPDADTLPELGTLIGRTRDLERNNGVAAGFPQTLTDHVLGPLLKLSARPNWRALGQPQEWAREWAQRTEALFMPYAKSMFWDYQEKHNQTAMAAIVLRGRYSNGGHIVLPMWESGRPGVRYATSFMSVEIDRLCNPMGRMDTERLRGGIEYDAKGKEAAYHIVNEYPVDIYSIWKPKTWERIPAKTPWGRRRVLHCASVTRAGQSRGVPALAPVLREFKSLARYRQAELNAAVATAMTTYFVETQFGPEMIAAMFGEPEEYLSQRKDVSETARKVLQGTTLEDNKIIPVMPGDKIHNPRHMRPNTEFSNFQLGVLRHIAACLGVSYETLLRDFSKTNYSSARAALLMDYKMFATTLMWLANCYATPAYTLWLEEAVQRGDIEAPGFYENVENYANCVWTGAARGYVDPAKEASAAETRMQIGTSNQQMETGEQGQDWEDVQYQRALEIANAVELVDTLKIPESLRDSAIRTISGMPQSGASNSGGAKALDGVANEENE